LVRFTADLEERSDPDLSPWALDQLRDNSINYLIARIAIADRVTRHMPDLCWGHARSHALRLDPGFWSRRSASLRTRRARSRKYGAEVDCPNLSRAGSSAPFHLGAAYAKWPASSRFDAHR
jgi:hypothetical protein